MLCQTKEEPFDSKDWAFEIKWDGYRAIADLRKEVLLYSRNGLDFGGKFKKIANQLKFQDHEMILDGEVVAYDSDGKPNFQWLQNIAEHPKAMLIFQVFDLLWLNGHSTADLSYLQRKELLKNALTESDHIKYSDHVLEKGKDFFRLAENMGLEGIVAKKTESTYSPGVRTSDWVKIKSQQTEEVIICGFTEPKGSREKFGSLILGRYEGEELVFCGHTGTGFNAAKLKEIHARLEPLIIDEPLFASMPKTNAKATWVKPEVVAEIKFTELTKDHIFRHPVFLRLRDDINPKDLRFSEEEKNEKTEENIPLKPLKTSVMERENETSLTLNKQKVKLTNQNKLYYPKDGVTKGDVIAYYQSVADFILPHLKNRPQSLNRFPNGIDGMSFYQKDASDDTPAWLETEKVFSESNEKYINYLICNDRAALAYLNNLGCIEMNVWTSNIKTLDKPDYLVLDLDPSDNNTFEDVITTAKMVKEILDTGNIDGYCKTSGSSGIHIYIPMGAKYTFDQVKDFGHVLMQMVQKKLPEITTLERSLQKRDKDKIYLDYLQNRRGQTLASVYSMRPKNGAPVSMPIEWKELKKGLKPTDFNIENALERMEKNGDLFKPVLGKGIDMLKAIEKLGVEE
ncbi:DNA ligase D [Chryseobacterium sp.]|uniref:DNA ligase D n=1 Tax=Chryseobacterium sp. TaxID=1871047 RepID=UPI0011CC6EC9|nr:DNA ligase D [Chryseobacterium sp.]TXF74913.1 DNA ligase D [Chryseobacterium sp.]